MKKFTALLIVLIAHSGFTQETPETGIALPDWDWVVPLTSPPLFEREGGIPPEEQLFWREFWPMLRGGMYEEALAFFRQNYVVPDDMEAGIVHGPVTHSGDVSAALFYMLGEAYRRLERHLPAETAYKSALQYLPDYIRVHESLGYVYIAEERFAEARQHLARAAELGLHTASLYGSLGFINQATDNPWGAVNAYQQATMLDAENEQWQRGLLHALNQSRNYPSALALVEQLLQTHENDPDLWVFRSHLMQQVNDDQAALASLETAIRLGHDSVANLQVGATLHMRTGSKARATELLTQGIVEGLDYIYIDQALSWLISQNEWDYARDLMEGAETSIDALSDAEQSSLLTHAAGIAVEDGRPDEARDWLLRSVDLNPSNAQALMDLAAMYQNSGEYTQAELLFQRASSFETHRESAQLSLAQIAIDQNQFERALDQLRDIVQRNPLRTDLRRNIEILENLVQLRGGI